MQFVYSTKVAESSVMASNSRAQGFLYCSICVDLFFIAQSTLTYFVIEKAMEEQVLFDPDVI